MLISHCFFDLFLYTALCTIVCEGRSIRAKRNSIPMPPMYGTFGQQPQIGYPPSSQTPFDPYLQQLMYGQPSVPPAQHAYGQQPSTGTILMGYSQQPSNQQSSYGNQLNPNPIGSQHVSSQYGIQNPGGAYSPILNQPQQQPSYGSQVAPLPLGPQQSSPQYTVLNPPQAQAYDSPQVVGSYYPTAGAAPAAPQYPRTQRIVGRYYPQHTKPASHWGKWWYWNMLRWNAPFYYGSAQHYH